MLNKPETDWKNDLFSNESKFNIFGSDGRIMVLRRKNEELNPKNLVGKVKYGGGCVLVLGCMSASRLDYSHILHDAKIFSSIDLVLDYQQIPVHEAHIPKTAITTPFGLFEFPHLVYGLTDAAQTFERFMNTVLMGLDFVFCYLDDILVSSYDETHKSHL
ncbi:hypothetical protein AVEN_23900-1 [Araneus ventricosus]|uniref:Reverse transcriptase domain-containing protein n=1 Tax=Araneus ventricosus TaxID=182803 RepID=A0A4Y2FIY1_ARAVE|nr:hypothetical protein AVEN_23900-1 [Araneus ventricosus]